MSQLRLQVLAGSAVTLLAASTGVPVLLTQLGGDNPTLAPPWVWWTLFALYLVAYSACMWLMGAIAHRWTVRSFAVVAVTGMALVLLSPGGGWTPILIVLSAALSVHVVDRRWTVAVISANTLALAIAGWVSTSSIAQTAFTAVLYLILQTVSVLAVATHRADIRSRQRLAEAHTELRATSTLLENASRANERLRIARDLHDVIGHQLTALALELEVASHHAHPPADEHVARARTIAKDLLGNVRATVDHLRQETPQVRRSLEAVVEGLPRPTVHLDVADQLQVDEATATALVRSVQEIVTNTIRHSEAHQLWIELAVTDDGGVIQLDARDDGFGARELTLGNGLRGLRERIEDLGGEVRFAGDDGFVVSAQIPVPAR